MANYRMDSRSPEEFAKDIKECTAIERILMSAYVRWLNMQPKNKDKPYIFVNLGTDNSGEYIEDIKKVSTEADFAILRKGQVPRRIEIKFCREKRSCFHLKQNHVEYAVKENICIITFMDLSANPMQFCILTPKELELSLESGYKCRMWCKDVIRYYCAKMTWHSICK